MSVSPRVPFVFETARTDNKTADNPNGQPVSMVENNQLMSDDKNDAYDYMYVTATDDAGTNGDKVKFKVLNVPIGATFTWSAVSGGSYVAGLTLPGTKTTQEIECTANTTTGTAAVKCLVKFGSDTTGSSIQGPDYVVS